MSDIDVKGLVSDLRCGASTSHDVSSHLRKYQELCNRAATALESLSADRDALEKHMEDCVQERIVELNAEAEAFDKECWVALRTLCENQPGFDWRDFDNEMTANDAYEYLTECMSGLETDRARLRKDNVRLRLALEAARHFIENGTEHGFIRLPEYQGDPAHNTLPEIRETLAATEDMSGWVLVPREPDNETLLAGARSIRDTMHGDNFSERARQCHHALLAAQEGK